MAATKEITDQKAARSKNGFASGTPNHPDFRLEDYPFYLMNHAAGRYNAAMADALYAVRMDPPAWRILMILGEDNPSSIGAISEAAVMKPSTVTRAIQRMQQDGLLEVSTRKDDNRVRDVFITAKGESALKSVRSVAANVFRHAVRDISADEMAILNGLLRRITDNLNRSPFHSD